LFLVWQYHRLHHTYIPLFQIIRNLHYYRTSESPKKKIEHGKDKWNECVCTQETIFRSVRTDH
jgi:hypothetical protein